MFIITKEELIKLFADDEDYNEYYFKDYIKKEFNSNQLQFECDNKGQLKEIVSKQYLLYLQKEWLRSFIQPY